MSNNTHPDIIINTNKGRIYNSVPHLQQPNIFKRLWYALFRITPDPIYKYTFYIDAEFHIHSEAKAKDMYMDKHTKIVYMVMKNTTLSRSRRSITFASAIPVPVVPSLHHRAIVLQYIGSEK